VKGQTGELSTERVKHITVRQEGTAGAVHVHPCVCTCARKLPARPRLPVSSCRTLCSFQNYCCVARFSRTYFGPISKAGRTLNSGSVDLGPSFNTCTGVPRLQGGTKKH